MKRILCSRRMKACDKREIDLGTPSAVLMERAAKRVYDILCLDFDLSRILFVCGMGNNGGDGVLAAINAHRDGFKCDILFVGTRDSCTNETARRLSEAETVGVSFVNDIEKEYSVIVDAIFGIGLSREIDGNIAEVINRINSFDIPVLSVDIPSGINADTGEIMGVAVNATETVAIEAYKNGHFIGDGREYSGKLKIADVGISTECALDFDGENDFVPYVAENKDLALIPKRKKDSHKGTYGRVLVIGGARGMCGAVYFAALAAYRCGAGLVEIVTDESNRTTLQTLIPEAVLTTLDFNTPDIELLRNSINRASSVAIGMGMGQGEGSLRILKEVYSSSISMIIDADALNLTANNKLSFPESSIITPHPLEFSRLSGYTVDEIKADIWNICRDFALDNNVICVLKDANSVISDGDNVFVNASGSPALAKGGSGDVLSGVIAALRAIGLSKLGAATLGVYIHGKAGEYAAEKYGISAPLAREIADLTGSVLKGVDL